jgi:hypothetical protein
MLLFKNFKKTSALRLEEKIINCIMNKLKAEEILICNE